MSLKRSAIGPQGDKDAVEDFGMASTPDDTPKRVNAAQLATRKIKDVKKRRPGSSPGFGAPQQPAPFSSIDPNTVSSFSSSQSQPQSNGFAFGQSQSFPGAGSNPDQPAQNGSSPFAFGSRGGPSSFNFSSSFGTGPSTSNPFATMNTSGANQPTAGGGFGGSPFSFGGSGNQASNQQPLPATGIFGSQPNTAAAGSFGNATTGASGSATPATTASSFGQSNTFGTAPSSNIFGQTTTSQPSPFTQSTSLADDSTMQTSPDAKNGGAAQKPTLFGAASAPQASFGASTSFGTPTSAAPAPAPAAASTPFGAPSSQPAASPFKPSNPFQGTPSSANAFKAPEENKEAEKAPAATSGGIFGGSPAFGTAQPHVSQGAAPAANPFAPKPASSAGASAKETAPAGNLFAPKPASSAETSPKETTPVGNLFTPKTESSAEPTSPKGKAPVGSLFAASSAGQAPSKETAPSAASSLFSPKPAVRPAAQEKPAESSTQNPFSGLLAHTPASPKPAVQEKPAEEKTAATQNPFKNLFIPPTESPAMKAQSSAQSVVPASTATPATAEKAMAPVQSAASPFAKPTTTKRDPARAFENLRPRKLPSNLPKEFEEDYVLLFQVRTLNECLKREVTKLDPAEDDFDRFVQFYVRVRETLGIPLGFRKSKRKATDESEDVEEGPSQKKVKPFGTSSSGQNAVGATPSASGMKIGPNSITGTPSKLSGAEHPPAAGHKRKSVDEGIDESESSAHREKRAKEASTTANAFAASFSNSVTSESGGESASVGAPKAPTFSPFKPSTAEPTKPSLFSTTPASSPAKPLFSAPSSSRDTPTSTSLFSQSVSKPTEAAPAGPSAAPTFGIPKFGSGASGGTNFMSQFKKQADAHAEKEKEKRKAEDYDSEDDDEEEWERKDAEEQRKKRENLASSQKRTVFVPGKGFVFEEVNGEAPEAKDTESRETESKGKSKATEPEEAQPKEAEEGASSTPSAGKSIFESKGKSAAGSNIFGHLSSPNPLFGATSGPSGSKTPFSAPSPGFSFGAPTPQGSSMLTPPVANSEASRSTTPGFTSDTGAEDSGDGEAAESLPQAELARGGAGEENEDVIMEMRSKGLQFKNDNWNSEGVGLVRVLKDRSTSRARVLLRADPSGKVILNALLKKEISYKSTGTTVMFMVPEAEGPPQKWLLKVKNAEAAAQLAAAMDGQKS
ncbi:hypothetical protein PHISP_02066 [Aspergillus sp. HF37]|nr:hypothetical protein PHISP_02066 [Aspergillus sp. HF37]